MPRGVARANLPTKTCATCGRSFSWRARWARDWDAVRHCSDACRRGRAPHAAKLEAVILELLAARAPGASICPSEAARAAYPDDWRDHLDEIRAAAARLVARGAIVVTQGPRVVDLASARGPIRLRRR